MLSIRVDLVSGRAEDTGRDHDESLPLARSHRFGQLGDAIETSFAVCARSHLYKFELADVRVNGQSDFVASTRDVRRRSRALAEWHGLLLENLANTEGGLLDRIVTHAALGGPEQTFLSARLAHRRGNTDVARDLTARCLRKLPGHKDFHEFAAEIGAALRRKHRPLGYRRPSAARSRSASMPPRPASPAGKVSRSLIRSPRRVGSSAACRGVWPSSAGMGSSSHLVS